MAKSKSKSFNHNRHRLCWEIRARRDHLVLVSGEWWLMGKSNPRCETWAMIIQPELDIWMILQDVHCYGHVRLMIQDERLETSFSPKNHGHRLPCACGHGGRFFARAFICRVWCNACINQGMACLVSQDKSKSFSCTRNKFSTMCWDELLTQIPDDVCTCLLLFTSAHWRKKKKKKPCFHKLSMPTPGSFILRFSDRGRESWPWMIFAWSDLWVSGVKPSLKKSDEIKCERVPRLFTWLLLGLS